MESASLGLRRGTVRLTAPQPEWAACAAAEMDRLRKAIELASLPHVTFEHIGSTAVPGLLAKPILDLMAGVRVANSLIYTEVLIAAGYAYRGERVGPGTHVFVRGPEALRTHHLHLTPIDGSFWHDHLRFRDLLRRNPQLTQQYAQVKSVLAQRFPDDRAAYTDAKGHFIRHTLAAEGQLRPAD